MTVFHRRRNDSNGSGCAGHQNSAFLIFKIFPLKENERQAPDDGLSLVLDLFLSYLFLSCLVLYRTTVEMVLCCTGTCKIPAVGPTP